MSIRPLSKELQKKAEDELNEVTSRIKDDINHIKEWLKQQSHLNTIRAENQWLLSFIRSCKFSLLKTKKKLDSFYTVKNALPEFFGERDPLLPEIQEILKIGGFLPLREIGSPAEPRVIISRCENSDPLKHSIVMYVKVCLMILEILLIEDDNFVISGLVFVMDMKGASVDHFRDLTLSLCKNMFTCVQQSYPSRTKQICVINTPPIVHNIYSAIKHIAPHKFKERVKFSKGIEGLCECVPVSVLPKEYGGSSTSLNELADHWKSKVEIYRDWFLQDDNYGPNETTRSYKVNTPENTFGIEGSFRKLSID